MKSKKPRNKEELNTQKAIVGYLQLLENQGKAYVVRVGSGAIETAKGYWFKSGKPGCPDIILLYLGRFVAIEVKSKKGNLSAKQKIARKIIIKSGGYFFTARCITDVTRGLKQVEFDVKQKHNSNVLTWEGK